MRSKPSLILSSRFTWFALVGALVAGRDMCAGGGKRPDPPADAAPSDAAVDGTMSLRELPTLPDGARSTHPRG
ncbi:MAG: hypothetical protein U0359_15265 [Byssovorax sp.]